MIKVIIAGNRDYDNYDVVRSYCDIILSEFSEIEIVSGRCHVGKKTFDTDDGVEVYGVDGLGERYAKEKGYKVAPFPADWKMYGKKAGYIRNRKMAEYANLLIAFSNEKGRGTNMMISLADSMGVKYFVKNLNDACSLR